MSVSAEGVRSITLSGTLVRIADDQPAFWDKVAAGRWEPHTLTAIVEAVRPGTIFVDIGAWIGVTALAAAACGAQVLALEPDPAAYAQFLANLDANPALAQRIELLPQALATAHGRVDMAAGREPGDSMSSVLFAGDGPTWTADAITVADLITRLPGGSPLVVKVDIEGGEYDLARDLAVLGKARGCTMLLSLHPAIFRAARGERALTQACCAMAAAFRDFTAERAGGGQWLPEEAFDPLAHRSRPTEWRLMNAAGEV